MHDDVQHSGFILGSKISAIGFTRTIDTIQEWIQQKKSKYVCICNTHSLVTAKKDKEFREALDRSDICTPDGMPLVWALRKLGYKDQDRVDGPNLMLELCKLSKVKGYKIYLYGSTNETLDKLEKKLLDLYPGVNIVGKHSPPFRKLNASEEEAVVKLINSSEPDIVFVGLGCPKQEVWMLQNKDRINGIMIGVGAAFDFISGNIKRAPKRMQNLGLEWLYRLMFNPRKLWKRYVYNNPLYIYMYIKSYRNDRNKTLQLFTRKA
ncbi:WecB/TagA/CpsF family glycosyltransferase [Paenibacillus cisolokensis]|uniref:WecB/TagA/CpsF family glycosyltransferase n=1 Tax=Paenibacillus cisolokensis TaxID=1658519 RepID=UPI003D27F447